MKIFIFLKGWALKQWKQKLVRNGSWRESGVSRRSKHSFDNAGEWDRASSYLPNVRQEFQLFRVEVYRRESVPFGVVEQEKGELMVYGD